MPVQLGRNSYHTVSERVAAFRKDCPAKDGWGITTELVQADDHAVIVRAIVQDPDGRMIGTGFAEEIRGSSNVNKTSAIENCETSAIGRALAATGYGGDGGYASADEVVNAQVAQAEGRTAKPKRVGKASKKQRDLLTSLLKSHVFTDAERLKFSGALEKDDTVAHAEMLIERVKVELDRRKAVEKKLDLEVVASPDAELFV